MGILSILRLCIAEASHVRSYGQHSPAPKYTMAMIVCIVLENLVALRVSSVRGRKYFSFVATILFVDRSEDRRLGREGQESFGGSFRMRY